MNNILSNGKLSDFSCRHFLCRDSSNEQKNVSFWRLEAPGWQLTTCKMPTPARILSSHSRRPGPSASLQLLPPIFCLWHTLEGSEDGLHQLNSCHHMDWLPSSVVVLTWPQVFWELENVDHREECLLSSSSSPSSPQSSSHSPHPPFFTIKKKSSLLLVLSSVVNLDLVPLWGRRHHDSSGRSSGLNLPQSPRAGELTSLPTSAVCVVQSKCCPLGLSLRSSPQQLCKLWEWAHYFNLSPFTRTGITRTLTASLRP